MLKAISRKEAEVIAKRIGIAISEDDGRTFFATNDAETEVYEYDSKAKRDSRCALKIIDRFDL